MTPRTGRADRERISPNPGASAKEPYRYRVSDPAVGFFYDMVAPLESALETQRPRIVWDTHMQPNFDAYMGLVFETIVSEAVPPSGGQIAAGRAGMGTVGRHGPQSPTGGD